MDLIGEELDEFSMAYIIFIVNWNSKAELRPIITRSYSFCQYLHVCIRLFSEFWIADILNGFEEFLPPEMDRKIFQFCINTGVNEEWI